MNKLISTLLESHQPESVKLAIILLKAGHHELNLYCKTRNIGMSVLRLNTHANWIHVEGHCTLISNFILKP